MSEKKAANSASLGGRRRRALDAALVLGGKSSQRVIGALQQRCMIVGSNGGRCRAQVRRAGRRSQRSGVSWSTAAVHEAQQPVPGYLG